jgi:beta-galactosidase
VYWRVSFEPGTLKAVSRKNGAIVLTKEIKTAGVPVKIQLTADRTTLRANGEDLCFITVKLLDAAGNLVPNADNLVNFEVKGQGSVAGVDNGSQTSPESFKDSFREAYNGLCLLIVRATDKKGSIEIKATGKNLLGSSIELKSF